MKENNTVKCEKCGAIGSSETFASKDPSYDYLCPKCTYITESAKKQDWIDYKISRPKFKETFGTMDDQTFEIAQAVVKNLESSFNTANIDALENMVYSSFNPDDIKGLLNKIGDPNQVIDLMSKHIVDYNKKGMAEGLDSYSIESSNSVSLRDQIEDTLYSTYPADILEDITYKLTGDAFEGQEAENVSLIASYIIDIIRKGKSVDGRWTSKNWQDKFEKSVGIYGGNLQESTSNIRSQISDTLLNAYPADILEDIAYKMGFQPVRGGDGEIVKKLDERDFLNYISGMIEGFIESGVRIKSLGVFTFENWQDKFETYLEDKFEKAVGIHGGNLAESKKSPFKESLEDGDDFEVEGEEEEYDPYLDEPFDDEEGRYDQGFSDDVDLFKRDSASQNSIFPIEDEPEDFYKDDDFSEEMDENKPITIEEIEAYVDPTIVDEYSSELQDIIEAYTADGLPREETLENIIDFLNDAHRNSGLLGNNNEELNDYGEPVNNMGTLYSANPMLKTNESNDVKEFIKSLKESPEDYMGGPLETYTSHLKSIEPKFKVGSVVQLNPSLGGIDGDIHVVTDISRDGKYYTIKDEAGREEYVHGSDLTARDDLDFENESFEEATKAVDKNTKAFGNFTYEAEQSKSTSEFKTKVASKYKDKYPSLANLSNEEWTALYNKSLKNI